MAHLIEQPPLTTVRDPVCGMEMQRSDAIAMRQGNGVTYYFCSHDCAVAFDAGPARYVAPVSATTGVPAGGASVARIALPIADLRRSGAPALQQAIGAVPGVRGANVNVKDGRVFVDYDPSRANVTAVVAAVRGTGFTPDGQSIRLKVNGLYCAECVDRIEGALKAVPGVLDATMNAASNEVKVDYTPIVGDLDRLTKAVEGAGPYTATRAAEASEPELDQEAVATEKECRALMRKWWFAAAVGAPTMILSYPYLIPGLRDVLPRGSAALWWLWAVMGIASLAVLIYSGSQFFVGMWEGLKHRSANMHTLIATGTGVAWIYSTIALLLPQIFPSEEMTDVYYDVTVVVTALVVLGLAMSFSSVTVIGNANRLKRWKPAQSLPIVD